MPSRLTRRESLALGLGALVTGCGGGGASGGGLTATTAPSPPSPPPAPPPPPALNLVAATRNMRFGSAVGAGPAGSQASSYSDSNYRAILVRDCGLIVPENELKWQSIRPSPTTYDFSGADLLMDFATANGLAMRGHNLMWHNDQWLPAWTQSYDYGPNPATEAARLITDHVTTVCRRYAGRILSWDAVNEAVDPATAALRQTIFSQKMGSAEAVLDLVFRTARQVLPTAQLVYNDYMSWESGNDAHRAGVLNLLAGFRARGVPVDALGVQSHIGVYSIDPATGMGRREEGSWRAFLDQVVAMGYDLLITEFDVNDAALPSDVTLRDQGVASYARAYFDLMFSYPRLRDVLAWGMVDSYSWLQSFAPRSDGRPLRPDPYDANFQAKPLHQSIADAFAATGTRPA
jgi:endo-1,4-beta-xylanase